MTYGVYQPRSFAGPARGRTRKTHASRLPWVLALIAGAAAGLIMRDAPPPAPSVEASLPTRVHTRAVAPPTPPQVVRRAATPFDPSFTAPYLTAGYLPPPLAQSVPTHAGFEPAHPATTTVASLAPPVAATPPVALPPLDVADAEADPIIPLPPIRPAALVSAETANRHMARLMPTPAAPETAPDRRTVFDKIFGRQQSQPNAALAYAAPDDSGLGLLGAVRPRGPDRWTAVYDIAAHTVTLPDGRRLEAHSGLGSRLDNPDSVTEHMRGATPPALYDLTPREALFHGVAALRLNPIGGRTYGRSGLLAHTFMLGPRGDSNGCVVFRDYRTFRAAYDSGLIRRLAVVARGG